MRPGRAGLAVTLLAWVSIASGDPDRPAPGPPLARPRVVIGADCAADPACLETRLAWAAGEIQRLTREAGCAEGVVAVVFPRADGIVVEGFCPGASP